MILIEPTPENKAMIIANAHVVAVHARPVWQAILDHDLTYLVAPQGTEPFHVPSDRATVAIFGDDYGYGTAKGPDGFDRLSLARYFRQCATIALVTSEAVPDAYSIAVATACIVGTCTAVVESLPERETEWLAFIAEKASAVPLALFTVEGLGGVH